MLVDSVIKEIIYLYRDGIPLVCPNIFSYPAAGTLNSLACVGCSLFTIGSAQVLITYGLFRKLRSLLWQARF